MRSHHRNLVTSRFTRTSLSAGLALFLVVAGSGCDPTPSTPAAPSAGVTITLEPSIQPDTLSPVTGVRAAAARIEPVGSGSATGTVSFTTVSGGTRVVATLSGLAEMSRHGFQILQGADCSADPALHLGAWDGSPHGGALDRPDEHHAGDLGNVIGRAGRGRYDRIVTDLHLEGNVSPVGRAVVIRAATDDGATQPDGSPGPVIGCGVVEPA